MTDLIWLNGEIIPFSEARLNVEDRGYQFADGVYEVVRIYNGKTFTLAEHLERIERSCVGIDLAMPIDRRTLAGEVDKLIARAGVKEGMVYMQITRGVAPRNHIFPGNCQATALFYTRELPPSAAPGAAAGLKLKSVVDERWKRCWIKSIALLPNVLAKNVAVAEGCDEAVFVEDGVVTECSASNLFAVRNGQVITHPVGPRVLPGITRLVLLDLARQLDVPVVERPLSEAEAIAADEVFITSTTREIGWVSHWNTRKIAGTCGPVTLKLHAALRQRIEADTRQA